MSEFIKDRGSRPVSSNIAVVHLRILTMNIAHGRGQLPYQGLLTAEGMLRQMRKIGGFVRRTGADLVCLQEVDAGSHWTRRVNLLERIFDRLDHEHRFHGIHNRRVGRLPLAYGNAVLSRFPIGGSTSVSFGSRTLGEKGFVVVEILLEGGVLPVVNTHLDYRSRTRRIDQVEKVLEEIEPLLRRAGTGEGYPPVICGDFNTSDQSPGDAVRVLFEELQRHHAYELTPEGARTFPAVAPFRGLDFILTPASFRRTEWTVIRTFLSDHRPVMAGFEIGPSGSKVAEG